MHKYGQRLYLVHTEMARRNRKNIKLNIKGKSAMAKYLYEVNLTDGRGNSNYQNFLKNVSTLNGKPPDFSGIKNICLIGHHMDAITIHMLCTEGFKRSAYSDVTVKEITKKSLASSSGHHRLYFDLIENYFLPYGEYPNL